MIAHDERALRNTRSKLERMSSFSATIVESGWESEEMAADIRRSSTSVDGGSLIWGKGIANAKQFYCSSGRVLRVHTLFHRL
jgi:hypothetical protein